MEYLIGYLVVSFVSSVVIGTFLGFNNLNSNKERG